MSRQGLRSSRAEDNIPREEPAEENTEQNELDQTIVEVPEENRSTSSMDLGGHTTKRKQTIEGPPESIMKKLEELERRVKRMVEEERKRKEKQEAEKDKDLQRKLTRMEAGINRSLEITTEVTQTLEERSTRIEAQFSRLEAQQTRIMERMNAEEGRREECRESERGLNIKYVLPEFRGDASPIRYMNQLKQYWEAVKPRDNDTHYLIERSLSGPPGDWWQIIKDEVSNLQTFLDKFSRRFWNEQAQHELKKKLEFGCHQGGKMGSRTEYAIRLYAEAKELRPVMSPSEIIQKLARHFNEEIKYAIIGRGITHIDSLVELLENFDRIGPSNVNKGETREGRIHEETHHNQQTSRYHEQQSWRSQPRGNIQHRVEYHQPQNTSSWQRSQRENDPNRMERSQGSSGRPTEKKSWRSNPQSAYQVRSMEIEEETPQVDNEEKEIAATESGNEYQPRL